MKDVQNKIDEQHSRVRENEQRAKHRQLGPGTVLSVGDGVMVRHPPDAGVSAWFQAPHYNQVFQVVEMYGEGEYAKTYTLSDLMWKRSDLGFARPVAFERLTPVGMLPLAQLSEDTPT